MYCEKVDFLVSAVILFYRLFFFLSHLYPMTHPNSELSTFFLSPCPRCLFYLFFQTLNSSICFPLSHSLFLSHLHAFFLTHIPTHLFDRAVPSAMWQPRCLLRGPVPVRGGLDRRCMRPESVPSSLRGTRPVPRRDLHLPAWLGGRAL